MQGHHAVFVWVDIQTNLDGNFGSTLGFQVHFATVWATRSATVGIPNMRLPPELFGISTIRTGGGK